MCYDVFTQCASYFEVFYYSYMNSFYGKMEVDFMAQWQPSTSLCVRIVVSEAK